jgi:hypothetical protein
MGLNALPRYDLYWSSNKFLGNKGFKDTMPLHRFRKLFQYLHCADNTQDPGTDKLFKIRQILDGVCAAIAEHGNPTKEQTVDEGMVAFKGRFSARQYMPAKPIKRGIKIWMRCDAKSGFCHMLEVYLGKVRDAPVQAGKGMAYGVVKRLTAPLRGKGYHIYMDNLFTSVQLMKHLASHHLHGCGTVRTNRKGYPAELKTFKPKDQGQSKMMQDGDLIACAWKDKKVVNVLSTTADPTEVHEVNRRQRGGQRDAIACPDPVYKYQQYMRGVDICDQLRGKYPVGRPCKKWWRYLLFFDQHRHCKWLPHHESEWPCTTKKKAVSSD